MITVPLIHMTDTELGVAQELLSQPGVKKYFTMLASQTINNLCQGSPGDIESDSLYIRKESVLKGQLALLETLLSIQPPISQE